MSICSKEIKQFPVVSCSVPQRLEWNAKCWDDVVGDKFSHIAGNVISDLHNTEENFYLGAKQVLERFDSIEIYKSDESGLKNEFGVK